MITKGPPPEDLIPGNYFSKMSIVRKIPGKKILFFYFANEVDDSLHRLFKIIIFSQYVTNLKLMEIDMKSYISK